VDEYFRAVAKCSSTTELWHIYTSFLFERGYHALMAMHMPGVPLRTAKHPLMILTGYPEGWRHRYIEEGLFAFDPVVLHVVRSKQALRWSELFSRYTLTPRQSEFLRVHLIGQVGDGVAVPTFGPDGRNGLATFASNDRITPPDAGEIAILQSMAQAAHQRVCELIPIPSQYLVPLSPRELEILQWVARGKSNSVIAEIVAISTHTVDTYLRRIYEKLGVTDRVSAAVTGVVQGLVSP